MRIKLELPLTLCEIQKGTSAVLKSGNAEITHVVTDSREAKAGDLFVALRSASFDGSLYSSEAASKGAYVLSEKKENADLLVDSSINALLAFASLYKDKLPRLRHTVGITGSVGKTSLKEITRALLEGKFKVHATSENQNNEIGVACTILSAPKDTEILICELGMNHIGEISRLSKCVRPDISVITNIGSSHIGNLGSREMIAKAKLEICDGMSGGSTVIPFEEELLSDAKNKITVSLENYDADYTLIPIEENSDISVFKFKFKNEEAVTGKINIPGKHILSATAFALAISRLIGFGNEEALNAIKEISDKILRPKFITVGKYRIYDDTYSSSPEAVIADLEMLALKKESEKSALLGDMLELGKKTEEMHKKIGKEVYRHGFKKLYAYGVYAGFIAEGAKNAGMDPKNIFINTDTSAPHISSEQIKSSYNDEIILFKASHAVHAKKIYEELKKRD